ncbi:MAG: hypothetical protein AB7K86_08355 [Rhodospirillales bacterium]
MPTPVATPEDLDGLSRAFAAALAKQQETIAEHAAALEAAQVRADALEKRLEAVERVWAPAPSPTPTPVPIPAPLPPPPAGNRRTFAWTEPVDGPGPPARNQSVPVDVSRWIDFTKGNLGLRAGYSTFFDAEAWERGVPPYQTGEVGMPGMSHPIMTDCRRGPSPDGRVTGTMLQYVDAASRAWHGNLSRASWQNRRHLAGTLGMAEGKVLTIHWSEFWLAVDAGAGIVTSRVQFRDQPDAWHLRRIGIDPTAAARTLGIAEDAMLANLNGTGPCSALYLVGDGTAMRYGMEVRRGALSATKAFGSGDGTTPGTWREIHNQVAPDPIVTGRWDECLIEFRSSRGDDGFFRFWRWPSSLTRPVKPALSWLGPTEYQTPMLGGVQVTSCPHHHLELYRWCRKIGNAGQDHRVKIIPVGAADPGRFMAVLHGPLDYYVGDDGMSVLG